MVKVIAIAFLRAYCHGAGMGDSYNRQGRHRAVAGNKGVRTMSKKPDYLTLCSIAAQKAGTSYGKYMAMPRIPPANSGRC